MVKEELRTMCDLDNKFVMKLLFYSVDSRKHCVIGMSLMENGSLEDYLKNEEHTIYVRSAIVWIYQVNL